MKSKFVILFATICLFSVSSSKKETNEKVKGKYVYHKDTLNQKLDQTEDSQAMGETENESQAEPKESIVKDRIKRHLFEKIRDKLGGGRPVPIIIINRYGDEDPGNAWGAPSPRPTKGWHAPPPPTKGWTTAPPPPPPTTQGWTQPPPPPPPANNGWSNLQAQEEDLSGGNSWNVGVYSRADARHGSGAIRF